MNKQRTLTQRKLAKKYKPQIKAAQNPKQPIPKSVTTEQVENLTRAPNAHAIDRHGSHISDEGLKMRLKIKISNVLHLLDAVTVQLLLTNQKIFLMLIK